MDLQKLEEVSEFEWRIPPHEGMRVPGVLYGSRTLVEQMDEKVYEQVVHVAMLPGIVSASYAMPDAHWGYGFPIGGVAAFDAKEGVISAGGVGFDISCGVRMLRTGLKREELEAQKAPLADALLARIPAGVGSTGRLRLSPSEMDAMLAGGARWAVERGFGEQGDLQFVEERGQMADAHPELVSSRAKERQQDEVGTLGSGNHYLEVQYVSEILDADVARGFGLSPDDVAVSLHCGSRGLGHQIGTEYLRSMVPAASEFGISLPDRELACAPLSSELGQEYLGAMRAGINCALANRQVLTQLVRDVFADFFPNAHLEVLYDVSHNTCKVEQHHTDHRERPLYVHRKGATRAFGPGHPALPEALRPYGQPVLIGGSMGTGSWVLTGMPEGEERAFSSSCHGAGRSMSRHDALKHWRGRQLVTDLAQRGILIRSRTMRGVAEEAPDAYKDVDEVVFAAEKAGLSRRVARLTPVVCVKG